MRMWEPTRDWSRTGGRQVAIEDLQALRAGSREVASKAQRKGCREVLLQSHNVSLRYATGTRRSTLDPEEGKVQLAVERNDHVQAGPVLAAATDTECATQIVLFSSTMPFDLTPAAQKRRQSRINGGAAPRSSLAVDSSPINTVATPPPTSTRTPRRSRLSAIVYSPPDNLPTSPSLSAPPPFDWEAARNNAPPPYGRSTPSASRLGNTSPGSSMNTPRKRVFRKPGFMERCAFSSLR